MAALWPCIMCIIVSVLEWTFTTGQTSSTAIPAIFTPGAMISQWTFTTGRTTPTPTARPAVFTTPGAMISQWTFTTGRTTPTPTARPAVFTTPVSALPSNFHDSGILYACSGDTVDIPWSHTLQQGETVEDIQWHYEDGSSNRLVAIFADNHFVLMPGFTNRVKQLDSAGLILTGIRVADTGNYTAVVGIHNVVGSAAGQDNFRQERFTVFLQVGDSLMTTDGYLHVDMEAEAVQNPRTSSWAIELRCGVFIYRGDPPIVVEWVKPSLQSVSSFDYLKSSNQFNLLVDDPVEGGNYTCRVSPADLAKACLSQNQAARGQSTIYIDKITAQLTVLEGENKELKRQMHCVNTTCPIP